MAGLHGTLFALAWLAAILTGPRGVPAVAAALLAAELLMWRLDLWQPPRSRRPGRLLHPDLRPDDVPSYEGVRHAIETGAFSRREFDFDLRRRLQRIASVRLLERHGVDLFGDPGRLRDLLGEETWALLDPSRPPSRERGGAGVDRRTLTRVVDSLERL